MILVDHNEITQGIPGLEEIPVIEVVDHHRIGMKPTSEPIKFTADVVGSTCTLVAGMYRSAGLRPTREIAGVLLCGIVLLDIGGRRRRFLLALHKCTVPCPLHS